MTVGVAAALGRVTDLAIGAGWRGAVILAAAALSLLALRRASAASRHVVLCVAAGAVLLQPALTGLLPPRPTPAPSVVVELDPPRLADGDPAQPATAAAPSFSSRLAAWASTLAAPADEGTASTNWPRALLGAALLALVLAALLRLAGGALWAHRLERRAAPLRDEALEAMAGSLAAALGLRRKVPIRLGPPGTSPMCTGVLRPVILLPSGCEAWPEARKRLVLLHELAHVARRDCLLQLLVQAAAALHAWNPLAWWLVRAARLEREAATDDRVAAFGLRPSDHAGELLDMARALAAPRGAGMLAAAVPMLDPDHAPRRRGRSVLERRIRRILAADARREPPRRPALVAVAGLTLALLVPLSRRAADAASAPGPQTTSARRAAASLRHEVASYLRTSDPRRLALTIDEPAQALVEAELDALVARHHPDAAAIVVLDPATGEVRALGGRRGGRPDEALPARDLFEPASSIKVFCAAAALDAGKVRIDQVFDLGDGTLPVGGRVIRDVTPRPRATVADILAVSSNVGAVHILEALGDEPYGRALARFHLASRPPIEIARAGEGTLPFPSDWSHLRAVDAALGHGVAFTPLQMAAAFAALANGGVYHAPTLVAGGADAGERVVTEATARAMMGLLEGVTERCDGTGIAARVPGHRVAGKTGTSARYATFVGTFPSQRPRAVILVGTSQTDPPGYASTLAAPSFAAVAAGLARAWDIPGDGTAPTSCDGAAQR